MLVTVLLQPITRVPSKLDESDNELAPSEQLKSRNPPSWIDSVQLTRTVSPSHEQTRVSHMRGPIPHDASHIASDHDPRLMQDGPMLPP